MIKEIIQELLNENPELLEGLSFNQNLGMKNPENFEVRYEQALEYLKSGAKADLANYRKAVNDLIKEGGLIPILIYNAGKYKGFENIDQPEERKTFYDNWDRMVDEYNKVRNDKKTYTNKVVIDGKDTNYYTWKTNSAENLKGLSEEQKNAMFSANLFMSDHTQFEKNAAFYQGIVDPAQKEKGKGDCNTLTAMYASLLMQAKNVSGTNLFPEEKLDFKFYMTEQNAPAHARVSFNNTCIEATHHYIAKPESDNALPLKNYKAKITDHDVMVAVMLVDRETGSKTISGKMPDEYMMAHRITIAFNDDKVSLPLNFHQIACKHVIDFSLKEALKASDPTGRENHLYNAYKIAKESEHESTIKYAIYYVSQGSDNFPGIEKRYEAEVQEQARIEAEKQKAPGKQRN